MAVALAIRHDNTDFLLRTIELVWQIDPQVAQALLDHLNERAPKTPP